MIWCSVCASRVPTERVRGKRRVLCRRCVLDDEMAGVALDAHGVCRGCRSAGAGPRRPSSEKAFAQHIERLRGRGRYDCVALCSGGIDSTATLYRLVRDFGMRPLAFTFDNGFETETAIGNARRAAAALGVDWRYYRSDHIHEAIRLLIHGQWDVGICDVCFLWYSQLTKRVCERYGIPLVVGGSTEWQGGPAGRAFLGLRGTSSMIRAQVRILSLFRGGVESATPSGPRGLGAFVRELRKQRRYVDFPRNLLDIVLGGHGLVRPISPYWFVRWDAEAVRPTLEKELGWRPQEGTNYPRGSTNCRLNLLASYRDLLRENGTLYHRELSEQIRLGEVDRGNALDRLCVAFDEAELRTVLRTLGSDPGGLEDLTAAWRAQGRTSPT